MIENAIKPDLVLFILLIILINWLKVYGKQFTVATIRREVPDTFASFLTGQAEIRGERGKLAGSTDFFFPVTEKSQIFLVT